MYYSQGRISEKLRNNIISYYIEMYENYEMKTVSEIASELNVHSKTIYTFIKVFYNLHGYEKLTTMIMLCTKFNNTSQFYEEQQKHFGELIRKRAILKDVKIRNEKLNEKRKVKRLQK